ncbi:MAG: hypothetical protein ACRDIY_14945 [Chloroflexota bacterium]
MSEISTRVWLDERLWEDVRHRAEAEGTTIRELIPALVRRVVVGSPVLEERPAVATSPPADAPLAPAAEPGVPTVALSDVYQCGVCGAQIRLGGLSNHLGRHLKEQQAAEAERS